MDYEALRYGVLQARASIQGASEIIPCCNYGTAERSSLQAALRKYVLVLIPVSGRLSSSGSVYEAAVATISPAEACERRKRDLSVLQSALRRAVKERCRRKRS
ncbi:hypothetical protein KGM_207629 [Danaus plexippus plexippus]|uniref:Uncharacterized protein n=1 Tax=Danaus plexippus plexippus TaxID=278856 RepID=A0A212EVU4_DANPL|nr:hypothetical protein KGM_207629 [Danaus plexippus plexippus]